MEVLECLKCRGRIVLDENGQVGKCSSCDTAYYFKSEKNARVIALLNQANISRLRGDFDGAILAYQIVLKEDETDADAYWGIALSKFGIDYVEDERTGTILPTCRRTIKHSILSDSDYLKALEFASVEQQADFEKKAIEIDKLQQAIKEKVDKEQDYDVFLCFKSTDSDGNATEDRFIARTIYDELEKRGIRTFFSEKTLKDRLGEDYEPIIYKALYTAKIFILIATKEEYIQAPWVRNEWSRFRDRAADEGLQNSSFGVFRDIKQNQLPPIFRSQGVDLSKYPLGGYEIEIADNLETRLQIRKFSNISDSFGQMFSHTNSVIFEDKVVDLLEKKLVGTRQTFEEKIERALTYNEIGNKEKSLEILEAIIDEYPRKAMGWYYKAQLLTDDFEIDMFAFTSDSAKSQDVLFSIENATRFATEEEKEKISENIEKFNIKLKTIETVSENMKKFDDSLKKYLEEFKKHEKIEESVEEKLERDDGYKEALSLNSAKLKKLKKQISNKSYYTKNIILPPNLLYTSLTFLGVVILIITGLATLINLIMLGETASEVISFWLEFILMSALGISPFIIVSILKTNAKLKIVKDFISKDKQQYETLKEENTVLKALQTTVLKDGDIEKEKVVSESKFLKTHKKSIIEAYKKLKKLYNEKSYVKLYIDTIENTQTQVLLENIQAAKAKIKNYQKDITLLENQISELKKELNEKKPKYLSVKFEKMALNLEGLINKFENQKEQVKQEMENLQFDVEFGNLKIEKTVSATNFFDNFLKEYENEVVKYLKPKDNDKDENLVKVDTKNYKKPKLSGQQKQFSSKKTKKRKNDKGEE